jgi:NADPH2:quinone reductase
MQTIQLTQTGGPAMLTMKQAEKPQPQPDEILVKTITIGINYADLLIRKGIYPIGQPLPAIMPGEIEGIIEAVGTNVKHLHPGQKVTGYAMQGYAEYALINATQAFVLPDDLPLGNGLLVQALTAQHLLSQSGNPGSIIITAAAGGVGSFAIQLAKRKGIKNIIALTGSKEKHAYVLSLGATQAVSYRDENWQEQIGSAGVDVILDAVGGELGTALVSLLAFNGTMIVYGGTAEQPTNINLQQLISKSNKVIGATIYAASVEQKQQWMDEFVTLIKEEKLHFPLTTYPFAEAAKAHQAIEDRITTGKVALVV